MTRLLGRLDANRVVLFVEVVRDGSFSRASKRTGVTISRLSRSVQELEAAVGAQLLVRTTRRLKLTRHGESLYREFAELPGKLARMDEELRTGHASPRGSLKIACTRGLADEYVKRWVLDFAAEFPEVEVHLVAENRVVNYIEEQIDVGFRVGKLPESRLVGRKLGEVVYAVCASPGFARAHRLGRSVSLEELRRLPAIGLRIGDSVSRWEFQSRRGRSQAIEARWRLTFSELSYVIDAAAEGNGLAFLPRSHVAGHLSAGKLIAVPVKPPPVSRPIHVLYPLLRYPRPEVRAFIDFLRQRPRGPGPDR